MQYCSWEGRGTWLPYCCRQGGKEGSLPLLPVTEGEGTLLSSWLLGREDTVSFFKVAEGWIFNSPGGMRGGIMQ